MALLSAKNKKMLMNIVALIGAMVIGVSAYVVIKLKGNFQDFFNQVKARILPLLILTGGAVLSYFLDSKTVSALVFATLIFPAAASTTTIYTAQWIPQYLVFTAATVPTSLQIQILGSGTPLVNLDGAGVTALNNILKPNAASTAGLYVLPIANGLIKDKRMTISFTNSVAATVNIYGINPIMNGDRVLASIVNQVTANAGIYFYDFDFLTIPGLLAADTIDVTDKMGNSDSWELGSINLLATQYQAEEQAQILNLGREYSQVRFNPSTARNVYVSRFLSV